MGAQRVGWYWEMYRYARTPRAVVRNAKNRRSYDFSERPYHPLPPRCPLESSNGAPHRMRSQRRSLSFIGEAPAAQLRRRMTTDPYVTTHFFQALTLNSPWCSLLHNGGGMTETDASTPPAAPAALGDGCARTDSSGRGSDGPPLARIAQLRHGCCPPPASLTPLACGCCNPPLNRAS